MRLPDPLQAVVKGTEELVLIAIEAMVVRVDNREPLGLASETEQALASWSGTYWSRLA